MKIHTLIVGPIQTNCCIAFDESTKEGIIIDPGDEADRILAFVKDNAINIVSIIATHGHWDHVTAAAQVKAALNVPFMIHEKDAYLLSGSVAPIAAMMGFKAEHVKIDRPLKEGDLIKFGGEALTVIHTPGHTPGSCGFYCENGKVLFSGDTLFKGDVGRTDFPGGSSKEIIDSVREKLFVLPEETMVVPGHGESTSISRERSDPYLKRLIGTK